jgi:hypothetical protein
MKLGLKTTAIFLVSLFFPVIIFAKIGVGVGTGKIVVDQILNPGTIYQLPPLTVVNTGDESGEYEVGLAYHEQQPELRPGEGWFEFKPQSFVLEPGKTQAVAITLNLPVKTEPGQYFAYLEGRPLQKSVSGQTRVGIAAAAKLYFEVKPANAVLGVYYKLLSGWKVYAPWPARILTLIGTIVLIKIFKKFFKLKIQLK